VVYASLGHPAASPGAPIAAKIARCLRWAVRDRSLGKVMKMRTALHLDWAGGLWAREHRGLRCAADGSCRADRYNVVWTTPSKDAVARCRWATANWASNLWVEENGDLVFYLSRSDSLSEVSRLLKVVRASLLVAQPVQGRRTLPPGTLPAKRAMRNRRGRNDKRVTLRSSSMPAARGVRGSESASPLSATATVECWRTTTRKLLPGRATVGVDDPRRDFRSP